MNSSAASTRPAERGDRISGALGLIAVVAAGILVGMQYVLPDKRVLAVAAATLVFGIAWRLSMVMGIGLLILTLPFPRGVVFGNTNMAFVLLLLVIWLLRYTTRSAAPPHRTPLDVPILMLFMAYVISFYNVTEQSWVRYAINNFLGFTACVLIYYLIVSNVNSTRDLKRLHGFQIASMLMIYGAAVFELAFPGRALVPGWIEFGGTETEGVVQNLRVGGPFFDYELLSEFCALNMLLLAFLFKQARNPGRRVAVGGMLLFSLFILFATVTRGALIALSVAIVYALFLMRRRLQIVPLTLLIVGSAAAVIGMELYLTTFTNAGSLFARFSDTKFVGYLPDSRAQVWPLAFERFLEHPVIGWGPFYALRIGVRLYTWPHSLPLFIANCFGVVGLACFVYLMWRLWKLSAPDTDWLGHPTYARAYLLIAHIQLVVFFVNEMKIEYLRNPVYQYVVWVFFSMIVAGWKVRQIERQAEARQTRPLARAA